MHPYLRAYMAGIVLPTIVMPIAIAVIPLQHVSDHLFHVEDVLIFPIGLVPNAWGLWNVFHVWLRKRFEVPTGFHGALLVFLIVPAAYGIQAAVGKFLWTPALFAIAFPMVLVGYYLAWKYIVARLNDMLGIG